MIPNETTRSLLGAFLKSLMTANGHPDYMRFRSGKTLEAQYRDFLDILHNSEEDLSIIISLLEKDPDCYARDAQSKLDALIDYVQIAFAIFECGEIPPQTATIH